MKKGVKKASYFEIGKLDPETHFFVRTSMTAPRGVKYDYEWETVYPGWAIINKFKQDKNWPAYTESYYEILHKNERDIAFNWNDILTLAGDKYIVLLCWCKNENYCHRGLLYDYLEERGYA